MGHKKVPVFRNTLPCNGNFAFRVHFCSVLQFPCFYCCVSILKIRASCSTPHSIPHYLPGRKEWLKNGKKNGVKNGTKTTRKIITVQRTFKKQYNNVFTSVPIGQRVFSDYTKCRILLLREHGKRTKEISGKNSAIM